MAEALNLRDEVEQSLTEGELPSQGGSATPTIFPGIHHLLLPANLDQCWSAFDVQKKDAQGNVLTTPAPAGTKDTNGNDISGQPIPVVEQHLMLKFDKDNPLVVSGGEYDGLPVSATISTLARRRGKKTDPNAPMVADMTYLLRDCLNDQSTKITFRKDYVPAINRFAGQMIRIESGLQAQCDPERVRYISDGGGGVIEDPDGVKGCGAAGGEKGGKKLERLYTNDFKVPGFQVIDTGETYNSREEALEAATAINLGADRIKQITRYTDRIICRTCGATLRGFFRIERFLKPLASSQTVR